jgi:2-polyprenyl-3-methyl-5-hydroxy-6-metoxy-1,4-benzoquinol methylase
MISMDARYDQIADAYASGPDQYSQPALSALLDAAGAVDGARALDLACGHGLVARELARRGASVVGIDLSRNLLDRALARESREPLGIDYVLGDASDLEALDGRQFDVIVSNFGLSDIDDLDGLSSAVSAALVPGGRFVFSILHPCFGGAAGVSGSWPSHGSYYDELWWRADGQLSTLRAQVGANHRTLSTYVNTLTRRSLLLERLVEPRPEPEWSETRPDAAVQPVYLVAVFRREEGPLSAAGWR